MLRAALLLAAAAAVGCLDAHAGYDVVFVAGQSNAAGAAETAGADDVRRRDSTAGMPVYALHFGQRNGGRLDNSLPALQPAQEEYTKTPATGDAYKGNTFSVNVRPRLLCGARRAACRVASPHAPRPSKPQFTKNYIAAGYLKPGRAVVIVNTGWSGSSFSWAEDSWYPFPSKQTTLLLCWAPDATCNPAVKDAKVATSAFVDGHIKMSLFTHAQWRLDHALSLDPATGAPPAGAPWGQRHEKNKLVAILWHQGEADLCCGYDVKRWSKCMDSTIGTWRAKYGADVPFIAGTFTSTYNNKETRALFRRRFPSFSHHQMNKAMKGLQEYTDFLRFNFGQGLFGDVVEPDGIEAGQTKPLLPEVAGFYKAMINSTMPRLVNSKRLGLADSVYYERDPGSRILVNDACPFDPASTVHFSVLGYQMARGYGFWGFSFLFFIFLLTRRVCSVIRRWGIDTSRRTTG